MTARADWRVWTVDARVVVTEPAALEAARRIVVDLTEAVDLAASRFRPDSELRRLRAGTQELTPLLAELVRVALDAAARTAGDVDPTLGHALAAYDAPDPAHHPVVSIRPRWRDVHLDGIALTLPPGVLLDLGATAKAWTADTAADRIAADLGCGTLVSLGGDLATAGPGPDGGWRVRVADGPGQPTSAVRVADGYALATSSTLHRRFRSGGHHILDPRTCRPAGESWRTVSVVAPDCVTANTLCTAAIVRGRSAQELIGAAGVAARLVAHDGQVSRLGGWPPAELGRVA